MSHQKTMRNSLVRKKSETMTAMVTCTTVAVVARPRPSVPPSVLSQLGHRIQHALRAFTPKDADDLRKTARTFPVTEHYDVEEALTALGIGEALVTVLGPTGAPTPLAWTRLIPPDSRMGTADPEVREGLIGASPLRVKYFAAPDRESAHEILNQPRGVGGEIQLTDGISSLLRREKVFAYRYEGKRYDCGSKDGFLQANVELALTHPELGPGFRDYLRDLKT